MGFSIDRTKGKVSDIRQNLETKKKELSDLESAKSELLDSITSMEDNDSIDENVKQKVIDEFKNQLQENSEKGEELSNEMTSDFKDIEYIKEEVRESKEENLSEIQKLEGKKSLLDKIGLGGGIENAISELDANNSDLDSLSDDITQTESELSDISAKLSMLWTSDDTSTKNIIRLSEISRKVIGAASLIDTMTAAHPTAHIENIIKNVDMLKNTRISEPVSNSMNTTLADILDSMGYKSSTDLDYFENLVVQTGAVIDNVGRDEDEALRKIIRSDEVDDGQRIDYSDNKDRVKQYMTKIDDKVDIYEYHQLPENIKNTFEDGYYKTVIAKEDILLYRVYGDRAKKEGCFLTTEKPTDRLDTKINSALLSEWKNSRSFYCEVFVPKGTMMHIGKVAQQKTKSDNILSGGADQVVVPIEFAADKSHYGKEEKLEYIDKYRGFEVKAKKIEEWCYKF